MDLPPEPGQDALDHATAIVRDIGPRPAGSSAAEQALRYVERVLRERGWSPARWEAPRAGGVFACRGEGAPLLLIAHVDSVHADCPGANDNAAAVGALLELAGRLGDPPGAVCLAFPDGEEIGARGTLALRASGLLPAPRQVVALDLVGRGTLTHNGLGPAFSAADARALLAAAPAAVPWVYRALSHGRPEMERSDHAVYAVLDGLPASHLMARGEWGVYPAYHTARDDLDQLEAAALARTVRALQGIAAMPPVRGDGAGEAWFVVPFTRFVAPGAFTGLGIAGGLVVGLAGVARARGPTGWRAVAAGPLVGSVALALAGARPFGEALAAPVVAAAWLAWAGALGFTGGGPGVGAARIGVGLFGLASVGLVAVGLPLLALPLALSAGGVGLAAMSASLGAGRGSAPVGGWLAWAAGCALAAWPAAYLVRPDAVRELAFHGLVPASGPLWAVLFALLVLPLTAAVSLRLPASRRVALGLGALALIAVALAWSLPEAVPGVTRGPMLWPSR